MIIDLTWRNHSLIVLHSVYSFVNFCMGPPAPNAKRVPGKVQIRFKMCDDQTCPKRKYMEIYIINIRQGDQQPQMFVNIEDS